MFSKITFPFFLNKILIKMPLYPKLVSFTCQVYLKPNESLNLKIHQRGQGKEKQLPIQALAFLFN